MFISAVTVLAIVVAALTRRPLRALLERRISCLAVLWVALALHLLFIPPSMEPLLSRAVFPGLPPIGGLMYIASLSLLVVFAWLNRHILGVSVIGLGLLMNTAVIAGNGGQMPVDPVQLAAKGALEEEQAILASGVWSSHTIIGEETRLAFLGDLIRVQGPGGYDVVMSPGDLVIALGVLVFFMVIPEGRFHVSPDWLQKRISSV